VKWSELSDLNLKWSVSTTFYKLFQYNAIKVGLPVLGLFYVHCRVMRCYEARNRVENAHLNIWGKQLVNCHLLFKFLVLCLWFAQRRYRSKRRMCRRKWRRSSNEVKGRRQKGYNISLSPTVVTSQWTLLSTASHFDILQWNGIFVTLSAAHAHSYTSVKMLSFAVRHSLIHSSLLILPRNR
jgi:hypothetical protein